MLSADKREAVCKQPNTRFFSPSIQKNPPPSFFFPENNPKIERKREQMKKTCTAEAIRQRYSTELRGEDALCLPGEPESSARLHWPETGATERAPEEQTARSAFNTPMNAHSHWCNREAVTGVYRHRHTKLFSPFLELLGSFYARRWLFSPHC